MTEARPVLVSRPVETRGMWVPATPPAGCEQQSGSKVWAPEETLRELDLARKGGYWTRVDSLDLESALLSAGYAEHDPARGTPGTARTLSLRGSATLAELLATTDDPECPYVPEIHGPFYPGDAGTEDMVAAATTEGFSTCSSCGRLPVSFYRRRYHDNRLSIEYDNVLLLKLDGGHGMFFDDKPLDLVLCHDCAHTLCDQNPWLASTLQPASSHSHSTRYAEEHPDHYGWDYDMRASQERRQHPTRRVPRTPRTSPRHG